MGKLKFLAVFFLMGLMITSCTDKDEDGPVITITSPGEGATFKVDDTMEWRSTVTDDTKIASINLSSTLGINETISSFDSETSHDVNINFSFDANTPAGPYKMIMTATDSEGNASEEEIEISIVE